MIQKIDLGTPNIRIIIINTCCDHMKYILHNTNHRAIRAEQQRNLS